MKGFRENYDEPAQDGRCGLENFRVELDRCVRGVATRGTTCAFLGVARVRRRVGAEEEFRVAAGGGVDDGAAVFFALEDRQAIEVCPDTASKQGIA